MPSRSSNTLSTPLYRPGTPHGHGFAARGLARREDETPHPSLLSSLEPTWNLPSHPRSPQPTHPGTGQIGFRQVCHHCSSAVLADSCAPSAVLTPAAGAGAAGAGGTITGALHVGQLGASQLLSHFRMHLQGRGQWRVRLQSARHRAATRQHPRGEPPPLLLPEGSAPEQAGGPLGGGRPRGVAAGYGTMVVIRGAGAFCWSTLPHGLWYSCLHPSVITSCWARIVSRQMGHAGSLSASALVAVGVGVGLRGGVGVGVRVGVRVGVGVGVRLRVTCSAAGLAAGRAPLSAPCAWPARATIG